MTDTSSSSSGFVVMDDFVKEWSDITLLQERSHCLIYTAVRYGRRFLLKGLRPEHRSLTLCKEQQEREFRLGISLSHPNIAATISLEEVPSLGRCIVQEYIDGLTFSEWLKTNPSVGLRKRILMQLLGVLEYIHGRQLVHHDLKSGNILITRNGQNLKLIDFGLSGTDDSLSPRSNDPREDIRRLATLMRSLFPHRYALIRSRCLKGGYPNIAAIRRALLRRQRALVMLPVLLLFLLLSASGVLLYFSWQERTAAKAEQSRLLQELSEARQEIEDTRQILNNGVDTAQIRAVLDSVYRPVYDSLCLPDAQYREIALLYLVSLPDPMNVYNRMAARYPAGSVELSAFTSTWVIIYNQVISDILGQIHNLPSYDEEWKAGLISDKEASRLRNELRRITRQHKK